MKAAPRPVIGKHSERFRGAKRADHDVGVPLVGVDFGIEVAHFLGGDFISEIGERGTELGKFGQGVATDDWDGVVRREVVLVID